MEDIPSKLNDCNCWPNPCSCNLNIDQGIQNAFKFKKSVDYTRTVSNYDSTNDQQDTQQNKNNQNNNRK